MVSIRLGNIVDTPDRKKNRHYVLKTKVSPSWADKHVKVIAWWKFSMRMELIEEDICLGSKPQYPEHTALHKFSSQGLAAYSQKPITHSTCECVPFQWSLYFLNDVVFTVGGNQQWTAAGTQRAAWEPCNDDELSLKQGSMSKQTEFACVCIELHHSWQIRRRLTVQINSLTIKWNEVWHNVSFKRIYSLSTSSFREHKKKKTLILMLWVGKRRNVIQNVSGYTGQRLSDFVSQFDHSHDREMTEHNVKNLQCNSITIKHLN